MKKLFRFLDGLNTAADAKYRLLCLAAMVAGALFGGLVWLIISPLGFAGVEWLLCFAGFSLCLAWLWANLYALNHALHDGAYPAGSA
ncbi:MAG: hypothetical protein Q4C54_00715 [Clostridia bacterium]|nr:hypothetical protein [Clostridia bacterium]